MWVSYRQVTLPCPISQKQVAMLELISLKLHGNKPLTLRLVETMEAKEFMGEKMEEYMEAVTVGFMDDGVICSILKLTRF